jgi:hypothetical protein
MAALAEAVALCSLRDELNSIRGLTEGLPRFGQAVPEAKPHWDFLFQKAFRAVLCLAGCAFLLFLTTSFLADYAVMNLVLFLILFVFEASVRMVDVVDRYHATEEALEECGRLVQMLDIQRYWGDFAL